MKYDFELIPVPTDALEAVGIIPGVMAEAFVDGRKVFTAGPGLRITTDLDGNILGTARYLPDADPAQVTPQ